MTVQLILILFFGLIAIWFGWRVFMTSSMVRSALSLLASLAFTGFMFLAMEAEFLGVLQIMMMATEMSIMAIFMMMYMMDPGGMSGMDMSHQKKPSIAAAALVILFAVLMVFLSNWGTLVVHAPEPAQQNHDLGMEVMKRSMMIFETAGVTILVAMIATAATVLTYNKQK